MAPTDEPKRRSKGREQLTRDEVVEAALALTAELGLDKITMRGLANKLGLTPMAAYYYVPNKQTLLELVAGAVLARSSVPGPEEGTWVERLRAFAISVTEELAQYPGLHDFIMSHPILPEGLSSIDQVLQLLIDAGFDETEAPRAYATFHTYLHGRIRIATGGQRSARRRDANPRVNPAHQAIARVTPRLAELHAEDYFEFGLAVVLKGLEAQLVESQRNRTAPPPT